MNNLNKQVKHSPGPRHRGTSRLGSHDIFLRRNLRRWSLGTAHRGTRAGSSNNLNKQVKHSLGPRHRGTSRLGSYIFFYGGTSADGPSVRPTEGPGPGVRNIREINAFPGSRLPRDLPVRFLHFFYGGTSADGPSVRATELACLQHLFFSIWGFRSTAYFCTRPAKATHGGLPHGICLCLSPSLCLELCALPFITALLFARMLARMVLRTMHQAQMMISTSTHIRLRKHLL